MANHKSWVDRFIGTRTDAVRFGWGYKLMVCFGVGMLFSRLVSPPEGGDILKALVTLTISMSCILGGEWMSYKKQDEFFKRIELTAIAIGGLGSLAISIALFVVYRALGETDFEHVTLLAALGFYIGVRLGVAYAGFARERESLTCSDEG